MPRLKLKRPPGWHHITAVPETFKALVERSALGLTGRTDKAVIRQYAKLQRRERRQRATVRELVKTELARKDMPKMEKWLCGVDRAECPLAGVLGAKHRRCENRHTGCPWCWARMAGDVFERLAAVLFGWLPATIKQANRMRSTYTLVSFALSGQRDPDHSCIQVENAAHQARQERIAPILREIEAIASSTVIVVQPDRFSIRVLAVVPCQPAQDEIEQYNLTVLRRPSPKELAERVWRSYEYPYNWLYGQPFTARQKAMLAYFARRMFWNQRRERVRLTTFGGKARKAVLSDPDDPVGWFRSLPIEKQKAIREQHGPQPRQKRSFHLPYKKRKVKLLPKRRREHAGPLRKLNGQDLKELNGSLRLKDNGQASKSHNGQD